jgi:predicted ABC-type ATPase
MEIREDCLCHGKSMLLETVFSVPEKLEFIQRAKSAGFFIRFFFIGTDAPHINAARVARRVLSGGHDVPITKIVRMCMTIRLMTGIRGNSCAPKMDRFLRFMKIFCSTNGQL